MVSYLPAWSALKELDRVCWVLDPEPPTPAHLYRSASLILISDCFESVCCCFVVLLLFFASWENRLRIRIGFRWEKCKKKKPETKKLFQLKMRTETQLSLLMGGQSGQTLLHGIIFTKLKVSPQFWKPGSGSACGSGSELIKLA